MSASRTYLSIGDVLTLLRDEFPDVTISKIRFLESQGLVNPERSPSGYRKFFDHDVERLRWVLRQQREHFLPLKVIRDRLADGELDDVPSATDAGNGKTSRSHPAHAVHSAVTAGVGAASGAGAGLGYSGADVGTEAGEQSTKADDEVMARILADASRRAARLPSDAAAERKGGPRVPGVPGGPDTPTGPGGAGAAARGPVRPSDAPPESAAGGAPPAKAARGRGTGATEAAGAASSAAPPESRDSVARISARPRHAAGRAVPGDPAATPAAGAEAGGGGGVGSSGPGAGSPGTPSGSNEGAPASTAGIVTGASLTADELCSASGLSSEELAGLESFGLIEPVPVAGILTYDEEALTMANLASSFRAFGIEPRHLRLYRNAVDREMGLIEQVVIPLLRQRNPESRQRALESADQLAALGQSVRATLLRLALRRHMGG